MKQETFEKARELNSIVISLEQSLSYAKRDLKIEVIYRPFFFSEKEMEIKKAIDEICESQAQSVRTNIINAIEKLLDEVKKELDLL